MSDSPSEIPSRPWIVEFTTGHVVGLLIVVGVAFWSWRFPVVVSIPCTIISVVITFLLMTDAVRRKSRHQRKSTTSFSTSRGRHNQTISNKPRGFPKRSNHSITIHPPKDD